jgi:hypothetical protein
MRVDWLCEKILGFLGIEVLEFNEVWIEWTFGVLNLRFMFQDCVCRFISD